MVNIIENRRDVPIGIKICKLSLFMYMSKGSRGK